MTFIDFESTTFVNHLRALGIILTLGPDRNIVIDSPTGIINGELLAEIRKYKPEIIKRLQHENRGSVCLHCGTSDYVTVPIHDGLSTRLECARCGGFLRFGVWYGKQTEPQN